ncbi:MAG: bacillithiol biosynthesis cysteine-adding enzyme BshC [Candidatus Tectomicrobia bacterium]|nr:bacillithiol biosynthesis cysteine-adding enzyme BshC [Candidatus Tectomicrobia bacterium]
MNRYRLIRKGCHITLYPSQSVDLREILPHSILKGYLSQDGPLQEAFSAPPEHLSGFIDEKQKDRARNRKELVACLLAYNRKLGASKKTLDNISLLERSETVAISTGQQPGLLTGPLYTLYKSITALKKAEQLTESGIPSVPVFWNATEDHDMEELNHIYLPNEGEHEGEGVQRMTYPFSPTFLNWSVGKIPLGDEVGPFLQEFKRFLPETGFSSEVFELLQTTAALSTTYGEWFSRIMTTLFSKYGLIMLDPTDPAIKQLALPIFERVIEEPLVVSRLVNEAGDRLERLGYKRQIHKTDDSCAFFVEHEGRREQVLYRDGVFRTARHRYSKMDLLSILMESPERFSSNATLRPIVSEALFPSLGYVGGPGEIAYWAQLKGVFEHFQLVMPILLPRVSLTLVEHKVRKILEKLKLDPLEFRDEASAMSRLTREKYPFLSELFWERIREKVEGSFSEVSFALPEVDPTLSDSLKNTISSMHLLVSKFEKKLLRNMKKREEIVARQVLEVTTHLFPHHEFQERVINVFCFLNRYGLQFVDQLVEMFPDDSRRHFFVDIT